MAQKGRSPSVGHARVALSMRTVPWYPSDLRLDQLIRVPTKRLLVQKFEITNIPSFFTATSPSSPAKQLFDRLRGIKHRDAELPFLFTLFLTRPDFPDNILYPFNILVYTSPLVLGCQNT